MTNDIVAEIEVMPVNIKVGKNTLSRKQNILPQETNYHFSLLDHILSFFIISHVFFSFLA